MPISTTTFLTALRRLAREISPRVPQTGTLTGGAASTIVISGEGYSGHSANDFDGVNIYIDAGTGIGQERQVTRGGFAAATGTWTVSPAWTVTPVATDTCIFEYGFRRVDFLNAVNRILSNFYMPAYLPIGPNITDIDMETSGVASWTSISTPATKAKITTASRIIVGTQALNVVVNSATEGVQGPTFDVTAGESILFSVAGIGSIGGWTVRLVDMTSGTAVVLVTGAPITELAPTEWRYDYTVPSGVYRMAIQIIGNGTTDDFALSWAMPVFRDRDFVFPQASLLDTSRIDGIYYLPQGRSAPTADAYTAFVENLEPWPYYEPLRDWRAANSFRIPVGKPIYPLFIKFERKHAAVSADADLIYMPEDLIVEGALSELTRELANRNQNNSELYQKLIFTQKEHARAYKHMRDVFLGASSEITVRPGRRTMMRQG